MATFDKLENIKHLSNHKDILKNIQELIIGFGDDVYHFCNDNANKCMLLHTLLTIDDSMIPKIDSKLAKSYDATLTAYFPNYVNKFFLHDLRNNGNIAFMLIKRYMQTRQLNIMEAMNEFKMSIGSTPKYNDKHIMFHLMNLDSDGPHSLFDFETNDEYEQLLIKSCKVRSVFKCWSNSFDGDISDIMMDVVDSGFSELINNIGCNKKIIDKFLEAKQSTPECKMHVVVEKIY